MTELDEGRERLAQARTRRAEADAKIIGEKIEERLGIVQVDIFGSLRAIELEQRLLSRLSEERVAELITAAVHRAERKAGELREILLGTDPLRGVQTGVSTDEAEQIIRDIAGKLGLEGPVSEALEDLRTLSTPDIADVAMRLVCDVAARLVEAVGELHPADFLVGAVVAATGILADFVTQAGQLPTGPSTRSR